MAYQYMSVPMTWVSRSLFSLKVEYLKNGAGVEVDVH